MKKYVEVDREPKVGDVVKVVNAKGQNRLDNKKLEYIDGDILKILEINDAYAKYRYGNQDGQYLNRSEFVVVEQVACEFTKSDIKGGYLVKLRDDEIGLSFMFEDGNFVAVNSHGNSICSSVSHKDDLLYAYKGEDDFDIIEVYGYTADQSDLFNPSTRELLFKREEVEDLGKKEYVIESTVNDNEITIAYNNPNGYDDSDDSIHILIGDDLSDDYAFTTISIQSAKDMIIALQEIVDYVEGGK